MPTPYTYSGETDMPTKQLKDGTNYEKAVHHSDKVLKGAWDVSIKIDGVRALRMADGSIVSRNSKPLYNLDKLEFSDAEIFRDDWATSVSLVRTESYREITQDDVYELSPDNYDQRLMTDDTLVDSTFDERMACMQKYVDLGFEGIVLREVHGDRWVKVVPVKTADVRVTGFEMSDKRAGWIKNFQTAHGNVGGTGFNEEQLTEIAEQGADWYIGKIMEVEYRETTEAGKLRFPAFVRWRFDKDEESLT